MNNKRTRLDEVFKYDRLQTYVYRTGARTIEELLNFTPKEMGHIRGVGKVTLKEITDTIDSWISKQEDMSNIINTPYYTQISAKDETLIQKYPAVKENQYDKSIHSLWLDKDIKDRLIKKDIVKIHSLLQYKEDEVIHTLQFTKEEFKEIIRSIHSFRKGIQQPKRIGIMYPFKRPFQYNEKISILRLDDYTEEILKDNNILTLGDLSQYTIHDLLTFEGLGQVRADEIENHYQNYDYGFTYIQPSDQSLPQALSDSANRFVFDTRTERGLSRVEGYSSGEMTVEGLLHYNTNKLSKIRDFGKASTLRLIRTLSEWLDLHDIDPKPFILLKTHTPPESVEGQLYRLKFTDRVYNALQDWHNKNPKIIELLNTEVTDLLNTHNMTIATVRNVVQTMYIWCKNHEVNPVGYNLFKNDYLHNGVEIYLKQQPVSINNGDITRKATVTRIETPTNEGLFTEISLVVQYNNHTYRINNGNELVTGYPIHFDLLEKL